jgi:formylglycine-generating enzyme required for sulfatase activity
MADVFLSYNRQDQGKAKMIAEALESSGFEVWWDTVLRAGQTYDEVTESQLRDAWAVVVLWSNRSVRSKWVRAEATLGDRKSALIPVMIEQCERPIMFELIQTADLSHWDGDLTDQNWLDFVADVQEHVARKRGDAAAKPQPTPAPEPQAAASAPSVAAGSESLEAAFWMSVQDGDDPSDFEAYLERYPQGHFAQLAHKRLKALRTPPASAPSSAPAAASVAAVAPPPAAPRAPPAAVAPRRTRQGRSAQANLLVFGAVAAALALAGFLFTQNGDTPPPVPAPPPVAAATPAPSPPMETIAAPVTPEVVPPPPETPAAAATEEERTYRDCGTCPQMTRVPGGSFTMGAPAAEPGGQPWERPQRTVQVPAFAIGTAEVTFAEWDACAAAGGCNRYTPGDRGWGRGAQPVLSVSWDDAQAYVRWLSQTTGKAYRLPTEAEWEFAARGGTTTAYWWGDRFEAGRVLQGQTRDASSRDANPFGLLAVTGNVGEWVEDCYVNTFNGAPTDGRAVLQGNCAQRVVRGGSWRDSPGEMRIASRSRVGRSTRDSEVGFRVATSG